MEKICGKRKEITGLQFLLALLFLLICLRASSCDKWLLDASLHALTARSGFKQCTDASCQNVVCQLAAPYSTWIGSHNITMTWESLNQSDVVYILQWTGPSLSGIWAQAENVTESTYTVQQLEPFTYYKFRVWAMIAEIHSCSPSSPWYQTKPFGFPSSPSIESIESVSGESVEVRWSLPEKPGGLILGFNLNLTSNEHIISVTTGGNVFFNTFYPTFHNTAYRISIAAVNQEGQGSVAEGSITTPAQVEPNGGRWVFASRWNSLRIREEDADFFTTALCLSDSLIESNITGVAVHYSSNHVFFSEGTRIWSKGVGNLTDHSDLKLLHSAPLDVTALTVDWLFLRIYYVSSGKVYYCGLDDCSFPLDMNLNLSSDAVNIIADPYNGWLFLLLGNGIYRCPLSGASGQLHEMSHVIKTHSISNFVVSFSNKRLVYHDKSDQTLNATPMDGLFPVTLYTNVNFEANSIVYEDDFFMLTNGYALYKQVGQSQVATFNEFTMDCDVTHSQNDGFGHLCAFSASAQPYPVPRRPRHLQVLFGSDKANVYWDKPENMIGASPSAWQNWTYAINCSMNGLVVMRFSGITGANVTVPDLQSSQQYNITVRACSPAGCSRSVSYEGTTLQPAEEPPYIFAASDDEIWKQDLDSIEFMDQMLSYIGDVKDMDWYGSTIYWTNSSGHVNWIELGNQSLRVMTVPSPMKAEALAFDWLGQYIYWSCNSNQICRGSTSDHVVERFLQAEQKILSLVIDSLNAAIYWTTETSVEVCRLDGEDYHLLDKLSVFSGKQVAGITLNLIEGNVYWLVQDGSLLNLYRVNISPHSWTQKSKAAEFARWTTSQISYHQVGSYSGRLVWLDENKQLRIQELNQNNSVLMSSSKTLTAFSVVQQMLKPLPGGFVSLPVVIPPAVSKIVVEGNDTFFQILWERSSVDYGTVMYCVVSKQLWKNVEQLQNKYPTRYCRAVNTFYETVINVTRFKPGTKFDITITPFSYWGKGESTQTTFITPAGTSLHTGTTLIILIVSVAAGFTLIILIVAAVIVWHRHHKKKNHGTVTQTGVDIHLDVELEYIRGLVGFGNACSAISTIPAQGEIESLPVFPRECLKLQRLLGSGAFGEVYEGVTVGSQISGIVPEKRVAVKTLRKDASDYEKTEFLKEAHLMSQFNHPNILRLLGVCLLNEPHYLILELMEGGDLRSYLRGARPTNIHKELLNLTSLLDISLDAATGCAYLERMHFVHRDIAARNCLVSVRGYADPERIVKIGDFGLARDVYKNDYYRKKGEGLLPVRWMSPESLADGIFNKYSDVWAFGVLLWEIMTLGKLPYPTYTNHEVLSYINTGGRLDPPAGCPQRLYNLMMGCWNKEPSERPNFQYLEETLSKLRDYEVDKRANQNGAEEGHVNQAYQEDEEEVCTGVDEDEVLETGLSPVFSNEGLNYLMYRAESPDSVRTDSSTPAEDR